jgi:SAM-dependent methyltransferase
MPAAAGTRCLACGADELRHWRSVRSFDRRSSRPTYGLARCESCGSAITEGHQAGDAGSLYRGGQYGHPRPAVDRLLEPLRRLGDRSTLGALGEIPAGSTVLDFGAGDGRLLALLQARGCEVRGVEPFADSYPPGLAIECVRIDEAEIPPSSADVVVLWHTLEHLDDPAKALRLGARALRPDGRLVVSVPALDSLQARIGGDRWFHLDVPRHAVHFTHAGISRLVERCGMRVVRRQNGSVDQNLLGMAQTLLNRLTTQPNVAFRALKGDRAGVRRRELVTSALAGVPAVLVGSMIEATAMATRRAGVMVVHAVPCDS